MAIEAFGGRASANTSSSARPAPTRSRSSTTSSRKRRRCANPFWEYARQKIACEERLWRAHREAGFPVTVVRPSYTYGPTWIPSGFGGQDYTVVDRMRRGLPDRRATATGPRLWVMTAAPISRSASSACWARKPLGEAFHITSDEVLTWHAVYQTIGRPPGASSEMVHVPSDLIAALYPERGGSLLGDKAWSVVFDNAKINRFVPEFRTRTDLRRGDGAVGRVVRRRPGAAGGEREGQRQIDRVIAAQRRALKG